MAPGPVVSTICAAHGLSAAASAIVSPSRRGAVGTRPLGPSGLPQFRQAMTARATVAPRLDDIHSPSQVEPLCCLHAESLRRLGWRVASTIAPGSYSSLRESYRCW